MRVTKNVTTNVANIDIDLICQPKGPNWPTVPPHPPCSIPHHKSGLQILVLVYAPFHNHSPIERHWRGACKS